MICVWDGTDGDFSVTSTEQMAKPRASSLPKTLPRPSCLCEPLSTDLPHILCGNLSRSRWLGAESPSGLVLRGSWLPLPLSPAFQELSASIFHRTTQKSGCWEPDTHLPRQPCAYGQGQKGFGLFPPQPCPRRWATGRNLGVPKGGERLGARTPESHVWEMRGVREGEGRGGELGPGSSQGSRIRKIRVFQSYRGWAGSRCEKGCLGCAHWVPRNSQ